MPDVAALVSIGRVLVAVGFDVAILAGMACGEATLRLEVRDALVDDPDEGELVFVIQVVVTAAVVGVLELSPRPVILLDLWAAQEAIGRIRPTG